MIQLLCHLIGDYVLQNNWMAVKKTSEGLPALVHSVLYSIPFLILTRSVPVFLVIAATHFFIDRFRLVKYWIWFMNRGELNNGGYSKETPIWLSTWLLIIVDNTLHLTINYFSIKYLLHL